MSHDRLVASAERLLQTARALQQWAREVGYESLPAPMQALADAADHYEAELDERGDDDAQDD
jgi:hypothetical protein